ncbi:NADPH:quinone reductase-like Zn-dependent oxidoreductase [Actinoplanes octamycinicus]|uniref:NADPH:quinone reductase-like Zn-dependent oxidoreductase n=1 Tax=Actinoplanes octamycinicus TaxID=135948 RepID=A0A7W7H393_9ACTN|nr:zinc-binding alcohol dehydrogenase family protein [Actinoplanes octamycinicus]MBB4743097.1 NADPH:quinone reductase-like Zn-dependent oxidoreductase [Actinoplanes octamycinicus]GIE61341.1 NADPH:quinone reductase [Actinoplanes octamycinicus]
MHAAVLSASDTPPAYREHPEPVAAEENEMVVEVLAAGLHHLTRSKATGSHYSSAGAFPLVPGADGVVRDPTGRLRYAVLDDTRAGTFAERTVIDVRRSVVLPDGVDPVRIAAAMNPAMSSWVALRRRIGFTPGQRVLIIGATGNAGRMAIQVAKLFGAGQVIAAGRDAQRLAGLAALGADETCSFDRIERAADVDVVLDYVWGEPAAAAMIPMLTARADRSAPLTWMQIGSMAGQTAPIPSAALRAARLQIVGSGIGSVSPRDFIAELPEIAAAVGDGRIDVRARPVPLAEVARAWTAETGERLVLVP